MEPSSPPKRMTRARAAKAISQNTISSRTSATKAKSLASSTAASTKRTLRGQDADDTDDELGLDRPASTMPSATAAPRARATRGRPRKTPAPAAASEDEAPAARVRAPRSSTATASTRTSRAKTVAPTADEENSKTDNETANNAAAAEGRSVAKKRTTTTRTKTTAPSGTTKIAVRAGSAAVAAAAAAAAATEAVPVPGGLAKKKVTFEEPEKENIAPRASAANGKAAAAARSTVTADTASSAAGLRAKPVRRAEAAPAPAKTTRTAKTATTTMKKTKSTPATSTAPAPTRTRAVAGKPPSAIPLSPKKVTQVRMARGVEVDVDSEDELAAMDEPPMLMRSPTKPARKPVNAATQQDRPQDLTAPTADEPPAYGTLRSPARRPPPTPFKDGLTNTPARRGNGLLFAAGSALPASTLKQPLGTSSDDADNNTVSLLASPAKRFPLPPTMLGGGSLDDTGRSPLKMSLLQTPAKRPASPVKAAHLLGRSVVKQTISTSMTEEPEIPEEPETSEEPEHTEPEDLQDPESLTQMINNMAADVAEAEEAMADSPSRKSVPRRLSPAPPQDAQIVHEQEDEEPSFLTENAASPGDPMDVDVSTLGAALLTVSPPKQQQTQQRSITVPIGFGLRDEVLHDGTDYDDSDDDDTTRLPLFSEQDMPATPCPTRAVGADGVRSTGRRLPKADQLGFTPLAEKLRGWAAHSPVVTEEPASPTLATVPASEQENTPSMPTFIDDAMADATTLPSDTPAEMVEPVEPVVSLHDEVLLPIFDDMDVTQEDRDLAQEANDLSLLEQAQEDDAMSEAGQDVNDENAIPIDPALLGGPTVPPVTPQRVLTKTFHTVSKVPLKASDESTPRPRMRRRSLSVSRLPASASSRSRRSSGISAAAGSTGNSNTNTSGLTRSATVISYSPSKKERGREGRESRRRSRRVSSGGKTEAATSEMADTLSAPSSPAAVPTTPTKTKQAPTVAVTPATPTTPAPPASPATSDGGWSTVGTPARTPRRDLNPGLLRGAVVFADVHTTEGADASGIFVELLTQMGARCVKSWSGTSPTGGTGSGVTHVVFKDGSKRTLDKVRESQGLVQCVGVSWVLDCERENRWLDEGPYDIDTARVPRGGARRRRSMEPQALANENGRVVSTGSPAPGSSPRARGHRMSAPSTPTNRRRRDSALWVRTPEDESSVNGEDDGGDRDEGGERDWDSLVGVLTPVPKTPAPEAIARYAANLPPATPTTTFSMDEDEDDDDAADENDENADPQRMGMRTCPPKAPCYRELGEGILAREKDERVLMRLMAARRKSLQFAPKIASPLSKAWQ